MVYIYVCHEYVYKKEWNVLYYVIHRKSRVNTKLILRTFFFCHILHSMDYVWLNRLHRRASADNVSVNGDFSYDVTRYADA